MYNKQYTFHGSLFFIFHIFAFTLIKQIIRDHYKINHRINNKNVNSNKKKINDKNNELNI